MPDLQELLALLIVAAAGSWLAWRVLGRRSRACSGCSTGAGNRSGEQALRFHPRRTEAARSPDPEG